MRRSDLASVSQHSETEPAGDDAMDRYAVNVVEWCAKRPDRDQHDVARPD
jgi:hypothetical protein